MTIPRAARDRLEEALLSLLRFTYDDAHLDAPSGPDDDPEGWARFVDNLDELRSALSHFPVASDGNAPSVAFLARVDELRAKNGLDLESAWVVVAGELREYPDIPKAKGPCKGCGKGPDKGDPVVQTHVIR